MLKKVPGDRRVAAGGAIAGIGGGGVVAYFIYVISGHGREFWNAPGILSLVVLAVGLALLTSGLFGTQGAQPPRQSQQGGPGSTNLQAGRDIRVGDDRDE